TSRFRGGIDHIASGAHAKRVDTPAVLQLCGKFVGGREQMDIARLKPVLALVDHLLGMFEAKSHSEILCFHMHTRALEHLKGVPGAVADSQHPIPAEKSLLSRSKARKGSVLDQKSVHTGLKAHLSAQTTDFLPDTGYNADEKIRSDMGFLIPQDMFRRSETHKSLQDKAVSPVLILYQRV